MNLVQCKVQSPIGILYLVASSKGLQGIFWSKQLAPLKESFDRACPEEKILDDVRNQLKEYFAGRRKTFEIPFDLKGTPFQRKVWGMLCKIPFGETWSYSDVARRIKNPKAVRAVGSANGKNPVCILIPCHRVIAADGTIGGYSGGIHIKEHLLKLEGKKS
jgi:methylated-DNA-[protein]-cysteine S-methyltransferase